MIEAIIFFTTFNISIYSFEKLQEIVLLFWSIIAK